MGMGIKALLVGVCDYSALKLQSLPLCKNDLRELKSALELGLCVKSEDILVCGEDGVVTYSRLISSIQTILDKTVSEDTLIFYFSGHGGKKHLSLSDSRIDLKSLLDLFEHMPIKNKIAILDSCHAGNFELQEIPQMNINETVEEFVGRGFAVMASCGAEQTSGFNDERQMSLYTSFLCDALMARYLIRKGKKSLESINEAIFRFSDISNKKRTVKHQNPIFRSTIGGTIFFDVEEYNPYKVAKIYEETDRYIIYSVDPIHHNMTKRLVVKTILRYPCEMEEIAELSKEICGKARYYEVFQSEASEKRHKGNPANIILCYFGYDESDMVNSSFICHTTWVDNTQDKRWWYRNSKNTVSVNGVHIETNPSYNALKILQKESINNEELIRITREYTLNIISVAERYIKVFREFVNSTLTEDQLIDQVCPLNNEMKKWFLKQSDLPIPPVELHDWAKAHTHLAGVAFDLSLYYDEDNLKKWTSESRKYLMSETIKNYALALENLKIVDKI